MQRIYPWRLTVISLITFIVIYLACYNWLDLPTAIWAHNTFPTDTPIYQNSLMISHIFSTGHWTYFALLSWVFACVAFFMGDRSIAKKWLFVGLCILGTQAIGLGLKFTLARYRPIEWFQHERYGFHWLSLKHSWNSTPSGHTLSAFAGCFALSRLFRNTSITWILLLIATLIGITRIIVTAHYVSDVIFGAYLGLLVVIWLQAILFKLDKR